MNFWGRFESVSAHRIREQNSPIWYGTPASPSGILGLVNEPTILQGRRISAADLEQVRQLLAAHPDWSRRRLSQQLATLWNWRNRAGQLKDMAARTLLLKLEQRGWIVLPARRQLPSNRMRHKQMPTVEAPFSELPLFGALDELLPLAISEVSTRLGSAPRALFENLLHRHHYLSYRSPVGQNLQHLVVDCLLYTSRCV